MNHLRSACRCIHPWPSGRSQMDRIAAPRAPPARERVPTHCWAATPRKVHQTQRPGVVRWSQGKAPDHDVRQPLQEGAFRVIRDEHTKLWRTMRWDRDDPTRLQAYDEAYREKSRPGTAFHSRTDDPTESMADKAKGIPGVHVLTMAGKSFGRLVAGSRSKASTGISCGSTKK